MVKDLDNCESCGEPNGWPLVDKCYAHVCGTCSESRKGVIFIEGEFRVGAICSGVQCSRLGAVNFQVGTGSAQYFCGGGPGCTP